MHTQNFIKIHPFVLKILRKNTFLHQSRAITLLFLNKFSPFAIPNHSSPISMSMQSLKKIGQKLLKSPETKRNPKPLLPDINVHAKFEENWSKTTQESGRTSNGWTDRWTVKIFRGYNIIPATFCMAGYKNAFL